MILLLDFSVIRPDVGILFWTSLIFIFVVLVLGKKAVKPIVEALKQREDSIQKALDSAEDAKAEVAKMKAENDQLLHEAREERAKILQEAKESGQRIVKEAKEEAKYEAQQVINNAAHEIENQKRKAFESIKSELGQYAVELAENLIKSQLDNSEAQEKLIRETLDKIHHN